MTKLEWIMVALAFALGVLIPWAVDSMPRLDMMPPVPEIHVYGVE